MYPYYFRTLEVDGESERIEPLDVNSALFREQDPNLNLGTFEAMLSRAAGVVLLYDITCKKSYENITSEGYLTVWCNRKAERADGEKYPAGRQRVGCVLVGNKLDLAGEKREVRSEVAAEWASMQGMRFYELDAYNREAIEEVMRDLVRSIKKAERRDEEDIQMSKHTVERTGEGTSQDAEGRAGNQQASQDAGDQQPASSSKSKEKGGWRKSMSLLWDALPRLTPKAKHST